MGEPEACEALRNGFIEINNKKYTIIKHPQGFCDGCCFLDKNCPILAHKVCCTGGVIFKEQ